MPHHLDMVETAKTEKKRTGPLLAAILGSAERPSRHMDDSGACSPTIIHERKRVSVTRGEIEDEEQLYASVDQTFGGKKNNRSSFTYKKSLLDKLNASGNSLLSSYGRNAAAKEKRDNKIIVTIKENLSYLNTSNQSREAQNLRDSGSSFERI